MKISNSQYAKILHAMTHGKKESQVKEAVLNFSRFVLKKKSSRRVEKILASFSRIWNTENGIVECEISSAEPLKQSTIDKIEKYIIQRYGAKKVDFRSIIKKDIKGGIIIRVGDEIIDASVEGQLKKLKKQLTS